MGFYMMGPLLMFKEDEAENETTVSESPSVTGYLALVEGDIIQAGDEWQTMGDAPEWLIVEEGDINIGKKYLPGTYMTMRRAR